MKKILPFILAFPLLAQSTPSVPTGTGQSFYALGMSAFPQSSPKPTGFAAIAVLASERAQLWSFSEIDFTLVKPGAPNANCNVAGCIQTSVLSGVATPLRQLDKWTLFVLGAGGAATTGNTSGGAISGGVILYIPVKTGSIILGYETLRGPFGTQQIAKIGFGKLFH